MYKIERGRERERERERVEERERERNRDTETFIGRAPKVSIMPKMKSRSIPIKVRYRTKILLSL